MDFYLNDFNKAKSNIKNQIIVGNFRITVLLPGLLRIEESENSNFLDEPTKAIWFRDFPYSKFDYKVTDKVVSLKTGKYSFEIHLNNIPDSFVNYKNEKIYFNNNENLKGTTRTLDMSPEGVVHYDDTITGEHKEIPYTDENLLDIGVVSKNGLAIIDDASSFLLDKEDLYKSNFLIHDYYVFFYPNKHEEAVQALYKLTGSTPLLPRFVFGNWWSRYYQYTDSEYLNLLNTFKEKNIPLKVATIDMDWHYVNTEKEFEITKLGLTDETKYGNPSGWTGFTWNEHLFKNYKEFLKEIKGMNLEITLNLHPSCGIRWFESCYNDFANAFGINPETKQYIPFDFTNKLFIEEYFKMLNKYESEGVDFWWIDWQQGSNSRIKSFDPLWGLNHFHFVNINKNNKRGIILSRYAGIGSHRYPLGFSGDTIQTWDILKYVISFTSRSSNVGYTFWSHDIGGHHAGNHDKELYIRWLQFALFNPIMRLHSTCGPLYGKEPWNYGKEAELIATNILQEREKIIPYLYSRMYENGIKEPKCFIKPLYYSYPKDKNAYKYLEEYFLGDLLVAPVFTPMKNGISKQTVYLPKGNWTNINNYKQYKGHKAYKLESTITDIPVFLNDGGIFYRNNDLMDSNFPESLEVLLVKGKGETTIYEDDGISAKPSNVYKTRIIQNLVSDKNEHRIEIKSNDVSMFRNRKYVLKLINEKVKSISCNVPMKFYVDKHFTRFDFSQNEVKEIIIDIVFDDKNEFSKNILVDDIFKTKFPNGSYNENFERVIKTSSEKDVISTLKKIKY